jgi:hypothetical protein
MQLNVYVLEVNQIEGNFKDVMTILKLMNRGKNEWHPSESKGLIIAS